MRAWLLFAVFISWGACANARPPVKPLTLQQALAIAEEGNPELRSARAAVAAAEGESQEAAAMLRQNPELTVEQTRRTARDAQGIGETFRESAVGISQAFEIAGQPAYRREAARHSLSAVHAQIASVQVRLRAETENAFAQVLLLQLRLNAEQHNLMLVEEAAAAVGKRVSAGEDTRLDGNLASVEAERARNQVSTIQEQLIVARARLATVLQLPPEGLPQVAGDLPERIPRYRLEDLLAGASRRPELAALVGREEAARSRLDLERASVFPDVTVGITSLREGPPELRERATMLTLSVPLPLFKRNQAAIGRAVAERDQLQVERQAAMRDGEAKVREQWARLESLQARLQRLTQSVLPRLDENLSLSTKAYRAGEIGILQLVVVNRQALDARRDYLEALGEFTQARIALESAAATHFTSATPNP
ncbi:MAG TPA: TolC family protein [Casimicrobiaceae bacterium]|nr:TolC family protein [Casimicrobiaceae bacterium]